MWKPKIYSKTKQNNIIFVEYNFYPAIMKKFLLLFFAFLISSVSLLAQRDMEHWIAPMMDTTGSGQPQQVLYFSTDSVTAFPVDIYNNNVVIGTVTVSKNNPQTFIVPRQFIITTSATDLFAPKSMGLYTKGSKPYYLTLRFSVQSHAEIITSKGKAGIGKEFYLAPSPLTDTGSHLNFMAGFLATEDNTTITVSEYASNVVFSNGVTGAAQPTTTFTLNKGQSYIMEGESAIAGNASGFIGAKVVANKPISVTNGNFNGQFAMSTSIAGSDIVMDQSVPLERLGNEFVLIKGRGNVGMHMEGAMVVATVDNTQIFINGSTTAAATINRGDWYRVDDVSYVNQNNTGHYNMHIKTSQNAYVYQLLAGMPSSNATIGYNYIPPLNCFLPRKIDEIGKINEMPGISPQVKLNIITEAGATVTVNGATPTAAQGPHPVTGTAAWVSYSLDNVTGNQTVVSSSAVTAGISGGSDVYGYGGFFAGFSSVPVIAKQSGDCIPGIVLSVDDIYDTYQWFLNGVAIPGATTHTYTPTQPGNYTCRVTIGNCPPVLTPVFKVYNCTVETTVDQNVCGGTIFTPDFTTSTQTPGPTTTNIVTQPLHGTAVVNPNGTITYTATPGYLGPDTLVYNFCGNVADFADCETVTVNINVVQLEMLIPTVKTCNNNNSSTGLFDLTTGVVTSYTGNHSKKYFTTMADLNANTNAIANPSAYNSIAPSTVYVLVTTPEGCSAVTSMKLEFFPLPAVYDDTLESCYEVPTPTMAVFNLTDAIITPDPASVSKKYYPTLNDALNNTNEITAITSFPSPSTTVFVRVINNFNCFSIAKINLVVITPKYSSVLVNKYICMEDRTSLDAGPGYTSYLWSTGATTQMVSGLAVGEYWVDLHHDGCVTRQTVKILKSQDPVITNIDVTNNTATLTVSGGLAPYKYSLDGVNWQDSNVFTGLTRGDNTFYVKDAYDCDPVSTTMTIPNLVNAITPNGDNVNDAIDYSALAFKKDLKFSIFDRYGNQIYLSDIKNNYRWDGRNAQKKILTGTYWYYITWTEDNIQKTPVKYSGWILVKNH